MMNRYRQLIGTSNRSIVTQVIVLTLGVWMLTYVPAGHAAPMYQNDPVELCAEGVRLYQEGKPDDQIRPLLEAGFTAREQGTFKHPDHLGACALVLGLLRKRTGDLNDALQAYDVALDMFQSGKNYRLEIETRNNIGRVQEAKGLYSQAEMSYREALELARTIRNSEAEANTLNNMGGLYATRTEYTQALEAFTRALKIWRDLQRQADEAVTLNNIGNIYLSRSQYLKALQIYQESLCLRQEVNDVVGVSRMYNNIAGIYLAQGQYTHALEQYHKALDIVRQTPGPNLDMEGAILTNIGEVLQAQGRYAEAQEHHERARQIFEQLNDSVALGSVLDNLGKTYLAQHRLDKALATLQQARDIRERIPDLPGLGVTLNNIGVVYIEQEHYASAIDVLNRALDIRHSVNAHAEIPAETLTNLGLVYFSQAEYERAIEHYNQARDIFETLPVPTKLATVLNNIGTAYYAQGHEVQALDALEQALAIQREIGNHRGEAVALGNIGYIYDAKGQSDTALLYYAKALDKLEDIRAVAGNDESRTSFIAPYAAYYTHAALLYHQQNQDEAAFGTSERGRARAFLDSLVTSYVQLSDDDAHALFQAEREAFNARQAAREALALARVTDPVDADLVADLEQQLAAREQAYAETLTAVETHSTELAALVPGRSSGILDVAAVQQQLDPDTTLVSYFVADEQTLAFVLTADAFTTVELDAGQTDLREQVQALRAFPNLAEAHPASAVQLHAWLIAPLQERGLLTTPHLAIVPHAVLHYLPFAALTDGEHFLIDDYTLSFLPSASSLPFIEPNQQRSWTSAAPLLLGNPETDVPDLPALTFAERETRAIAGLYDVTPLLGDQATETALHAQAGQAGIVHIAAHGAYNPVAPLASTLYLGPDETNDGHLEVGEVYGLDLNQTDLVVLSACETQLGELSAGDELVGLTRAFVFAGTPSVMATLWSVEDEATSLLMERFYTHLRDGAGKARALRQAQLEVREQYPNPYYWAGFTLSGDAGSVHAAAPWWLWIAIAGVMVSSIAGLIIWRQARSRWVS